MEITDVRVKLINDASERLKAVCTVTFDGEFVVRDIKVVEGDDGFFVAMPSRKLTGRCPKCGHKNQLRARHCEDCGGKLPNQEIPADSAGRTRLYRDTAHPITPAFREKLQSHVVEAYHEACDVALEESQSSEVEENATDSASPADERPADETLVSESPADELVAEESRVDELPGDEAPVDESRDADDADEEPNDEVDDEDSVKGEAGAGSNEEYNSLIAGLKGGSTDSASARRSDDRPSREGEKRGDRGRRGGRGSGRGKERGEKKPDRAPKADDKAEKKSTDRKTSDRKPSDRKTTDRKTTDRQEKCVVESAKPAAPKKPSAPKEPAIAKKESDMVSVSGAAENVPVTQDVNDDSAPFGMGL